LFLPAACPSIPDDLTPASIRASGARVISYGAPTYPGAMFLLAELDGVPMVGLPGCAMYHKATILELIIPRLLAGETVSKARHYRPRPRRSLCGVQGMPLSGLRIRQVTAFA
jgi:molybdopterin biosynthesis enzyme